MEPPVIDCGAARMTVGGETGRQVSDSLPLLWTEGEASPAAPAVYHMKSRASVKTASLLLRVRTKRFLLQGVDARSHEPNEWLVPFLCSRTEKVNSPGLLPLFGRASGRLLHVTHSVVARLKIHATSLLKPSSAAAASPRLATTVHLIVPLSAAFCPLLSCQLTCSNQSRGRAYHRSCLLSA